ncbi:hypothetical protein [Carnobacterium divergens]|uniref:hypothetical protein n=1 Tax=Carnobacterium divergens TaxID=2748 RepID=UPI0028913A9A|nr:hypothetical protein [Carnobacterium divergens]MDT2010826.1 hypothetical protein [Carnobacterium divergens]
MMRLKSIFIVLVIVVLSVLSYSLVNVINSSKETVKENKELVVRNKKIEKENEQMSKTISRLESLKEVELDTEQGEKKEEVPSVVEKESKNEKLEKINSEFVSVSFNFKDSSGRSNNMKAYMTEELKKKYVENNNSSKTSELENVKVSGELKEYEVYTDTSESGKIKVINDVKVTYDSGSEKTEHRMMFSVTYDDKTLEVQDIQFFPVVNTDH